MLPRLTGGARTRTAFTLIEVIVVLLVLGALAAIAVLGYTHFTNKALRTAEDANMRNIGTAVLVAYTAAGNHGPLTRDLVTSALEDSFSVAVTDEVTASTTWSLTAPDTPPIGKGEYSVAFDAGAEGATISATTGARALIAAQSQVPGREIVAAVVTVASASDSDGTIMSLCSSEHHTGAGPALYDLGYQTTCGNGSAPVFDGGSETAPLIRAAQNVTLTPGDSFIEVEWDAPQGATSYTVVALTAPDPTPVAECQTTDTSCTLTGLVNGVEHTVLVTSHGLHNSAISDPVTATPLPGAPTTAPQVEVADVGHTTARFTWPAIEGQEVTGYQVEHRIGTQPWTRVTVADDTEFTVGPVTEGSLVQLRARAVNLGGFGPWSPAAAAQLTIAPPEVSPTLTTSGITQTEVTFSWTAVPKATAYQVRTRVNGSSWTEREATTSRTMKLTGQPVGATIEAQVRAGTTGGWGPWSSTAEAQLDVPVPAAVTISSALSGSTVTFSWNAPQYATGYQVYQRVDGGSWELVTQNQAERTHAMNTSPGQTVGVRVRARSAAGLSGYTDAYHTRTPAAPSVTGSATSHTQASYSWPAVHGATSYYVGVRCNTGTWTYSTQTSRSKTVTCNQGDTTAISVRARNAAGDSSAATSTVGLTIAAPAAPTVMSTWTEYPVMYVRGDNVTCPAGTVIQSRSRHRWNSDAWGSWSAWVDSGHSSRSATYTSSTQYYDNLTSRHIQVRCRNTATERVSPASASALASGVAHPMPRPTGLTVQVGGTGETWRSAKWSASCAPQTSVRYGYTIRATTFTVSENMVTKTSYSRTNQAWGSGDINVAAVCVSPGGRIGPQVNVRKNF